MLRCREPAGEGYLVRHLRRTDWRGQEPGPGSRLWLLDRCRAELTWAMADYNRLAGTYGHDTRYDGPHPSEGARLPHEHAAARVLVCWGHVSVHDSLIVETIGPLRRQRRQAPDMAAVTVEYLRALWTRRRTAWRAHLQAVEDYRQARAAIDHGMREAA